MFKPSLKSFSLDSVSAAVGQAFFALGLAMLGSMIFGSYIKDEKANILKQASIVSVSIVAAGLAAGMMIFPMVFAFDLEPGAGTGLTMITLPNVFNYISGGRIIGTLFYVGFYFAALSSAIGIAEAISAVFMDIFSIGRKKAVAAVMILAVIIGSCSILIPGFLDTVDIITSNYLLVISGLAIDIFTAGIWGADNLMNAIHVHNPAVRAWLSLSLKYLCPVALILILISNFI